MSHAFWYGNRPSRYTSNILSSPQEKTPGVPRTAPGAGAGVSVSTQAGSVFHHIKSAYRGHRLPRAPSRAAGSAPPSIHRESDDPAKGRDEPYPGWRSSNP